MPEEQTFERIERAYEMPEYMQAAETMDLRSPRGEIGDQGIETAELHGDGVLLIAGEDDAVEITNRGFTDDKYRKLLKKVGELTNSSDPIERAVALKVVGLMCEVGL